MSLDSEHIFKVFLNYKEIPYFKLHLEPVPGVL